MFSETCGSALLASFQLDAPIIVLEYSKKMQQKLAKISSWILKVAPLSNIDSMKIVVQEAKIDTLPQKDYTFARPLKRNRTSRGDSFSSSSDDANKKTRRGSARSLTKAGTSFEFDNSVALLSLRRPSRFLAPGIIFI